MTELLTQPAGQNDLNIEQAVRERYSQAAQSKEAALCCPVEYDHRYLEAIPQEILERDYGCGDPSKFLLEGETVLDLGSGGGKICYIAAQIVGEKGKVIGVDCNDTMLALSNKYRHEMAEKLGYANVEFRKGKIQDLQLNLELLEKHLAENPVSTSNDWLNAQEYATELKTSSPLIAEDSIDVVISNCVLNLVRQEDRRQLFGEMARVLRRGGRAVISDIVCDEDIPERLQNDPKLWSGCISGSFREDGFLKAFEDAGFYGIEILSRQEQPWAIVEGLEFRSVTVQAFQGKDGPCLDRKQAVIYNGPWKSVIDDDGHKLLRGERMAVCDKTFGIYTEQPYAESITAVPPHQEVPPEKATAFSCKQSPIRSPKETKGGDSRLTVLPESDCCGSSDSCC